MSNFRHYLLTAARLFAQARRAEDQRDRNEYLADADEALLRAERSARPHKDRYHAVRRAG